MSRETDDYGAGAPEEQEREHCERLAKEYHASGRPWTADALLELRAQAFAAGAASRDAEVAELKSRLGAWERAASEMLTERDGLKRATDEMTRRMFDLRNERDARITELAESKRRVARLESDNAILEREVRRLAK